MASLFWTEEEIKSPKMLKSNVLPTKTDCLLYYASRLSLGRPPTESRTSVIRSLCDNVSEIWMKADTCPVDVKYIIEKFESDVWGVYTKLLRDYDEDGVKKSKQKKSTTTSTSEPPCKKTRQSGTTSRRQIWDTKHGKCLFDVRSKYKINQGFYFDTEFFDDQMGPRKLVMITSKVTDEYWQAVLKKRETERRKKSNLTSAIGKIQFF